MSRRTIQNARVVVTGASSGIGREIVWELARQRARLLVTARRQERLDSLVRDLQEVGCLAHAIAGDITDADVRNMICGEVESVWGGLDILVNNAGIGAIGPFLDADEARLRRIMEVNFFAPVELLRKSLPLLQLGSRPIVVNVGSVLGHRAVPKKSEYCASKFALHGFSDALRAELRRLGIDVLLVSPSTTQSEFFDSVLEGKALEGKALEGKALEGKGNQRARSRGMPASVVARKTVRAMRRGTHELILSPGGKALVWLDRFWPTFADWLVAAGTR